MPTVAIHPPKTPVHKGSHTIAKATIPNICKMPGPPAPFVPAPLPNIAKSELSPKDYSTTVKIEGNSVAIRGATFESIGDMASKGTGGGLISANCHGPAKFVAPGSMTVKIEGKNVQLLGDSMLNNLGASGSPPNTGATMMGADHPELSAEEKCKAAKEEAKRLADEDLKLSDEERPAARSVLVTPQLDVNPGRSKGFILPEVKKLAEKYPDGDENGYKCAELNAISKTLSFQGPEALRGSIIVTVDVRKPTAKSAANHGEKKPACAVCKPLLEELGIIEC